MTVPQKQHESYAPSSLVFGERKAGMYLYRTVIHTTAQNKILDGCALEIPIRVSSHRIPFC